MKRQISFGDKKINFKIEYRDRKTLGIKVHPDGGVEVFAPNTATEKQILDKVRLKAPWISKQLTTFKSYRPATPPRRFVSGETHLYLGRQYRLKILTDTETAVKAYRGQLWIQSQKSTPEILKKHLDHWYKERAVVIFNELLNEALPKFRKYGIAAPSLIIRTLSKRWGSCTPAGKIILNLELIKAPKGCIEYVIIHELCHLVHYDHAKEFRNLLSRMMPDWRKWKERLEYMLA